MTSTMNPDVATAPHRGAGGDSRVRGIAREIGTLRVPLTLLGALVVLMSVTQPVFLTESNLTNAISSVAALSGIVLVKMLEAGVPFPIAAVLTVLVGAAVGAAANGFLVGYLKLNVFVVTLASMISITGAVSLWTNTQSFYVDSESLVWLVSGHIAGVPVIIVLMLLVLAAFLFIQRRTYFGRDVYAVGASPVAAELSGIRNGRVILAVYAAAGGCAALGGIIAVGRVGAATPQVDNNLPLQAIAAILIGGTSLVGGIGGVGGTAVGVVFMGVLQNGLSISGVQSFWQQVLTGIVLVVAVLGDRISTTFTFPRRRRASTVPATETPDVPPTT